MADNAYFDRSILAPLGHYGNTGLSIYNAATIVTTRISNELS